MDVRPDFEALQRTVRRVATERVPLCEVLIEFPIQSQFLGREVAADDLQAQVEFWVRAGYDYFPLTIGMMTPGKVTDESAISQVIRDTVVRDSPEAENGMAWNLEFTSFINNRDDFDRFPWEAAAKINFSKFEQIQKILPRGMKVIALSGKLFTLGWMLMGFNNFCISLMTDERLVADVMGRIGDIQSQALEKILDMPHVGGVWLVDDLAFGTGPMIPPWALRDHVFPCYRKMAARCHAKGLLVFMHTDGNLSTVMDDIIDMGVDLLHPIDPTCMDILKVKEAYGDRLCLAGNVSNELLQTGTPAEVTATVKELIRKLAPGGGYCVGSGNSVTSWSKFENYMAMRDATLNHGRYTTPPQSLDSAEGNS